MEWFNYKKVKVIIFKIFIIIKTIQWISNSSYQQYILVSDLWLNKLEENVTVNFHLLYIMHIYSFFLFIIVLVLKSYVSKFKHLWYSYFFYIKTIFFLKSIIFNFLR